MRDTSLEAFSMLCKLNEKQAAVYSVICKHHPISDLQIAEKLGWPINRVTPRRNELEKGKIIFSAGKAKQITGRNAHVWEPTDKQLTLF